MFLYLQEQGEDDQDGVGKRSRAKSQSIKLIEHIEMLDNLETELYKVNDDISIILHVHWLKTKAEFLWCVCVLRSKK